MQRRAADPGDRDLAQGPDPLSWFRGRPALPTWNIGNSMLMVPKVDAMLPYSRTCHVIRMIAADARRSFLNSTPCPCEDRWDASMTLERTNGRAPSGETRALFGFVPLDAEGAGLWGIRRTSLLGHQVPHCQVPMTPESKHPCLAGFKTRRD